MILGSWEFCIALFFLFFELMIREWLSPGGSWTASFGWVVDDRSAVKAHDDGVLILGNGLLVMALGALDFRVNHDASRIWTEAARLLSQRFRFCKNNGTFLSIILNRHRPVKINFQFLLVVSTLGLER